MILVINLQAGRGKASKYIGKIKSLLDCRKKKYDMVMTEYSGHAAVIAREYSNTESRLIYSLGGDGTLNEITNGAVNTGSVVVNIPTGSGNDFIKSVTDLRDPMEIFERSFGAEERLIDTMKVNGRYCINIASVGLDASVAHMANKIKKIPLLSGSLAYYLSIFLTLIKHRSYKLKVTIDSRTVEKEFLLIAVANGKYYGGGMKALPDAVIDDGLLDICMVDNMGTLKIISLLNKYKKGEHKGLKQVTFETAKKIRIESSKPLQINIDGEIMQDRTVVIEVVPKSLRILSI